tara:strand:+ start:55026 stop:55226 length:201 start_codon:yes stop_codon:yes gene_type:complete
MKIVGFHHQTIVNVLILGIIALAVWLLKDGTAMLGLAFLQPTPINILDNEMPENDDPKIGFTADLD